MQKLDNYIQELLSLALYKTKNIYEAEELVQESLLTALIYINKGNEIKDYKSYLISVLNGKYNDMLRRKYNKPLTYLQDNFEIIDDNDIHEKIIKSEEYERVRKAIAFLSKSYREIIISYYMNNMSINEIALKYNINENTIKTRLHIARSKLKKGLLNMKSYTKESYSPIKLVVNNSYSEGVNGEPGSLVNNNLLVQNILYIAYSKPKTIEEIASEIGVPMAYVEPIIDDLVDNELVKKIDNNYYTDFIIYKFKDLTKHINDQKQFVDDNFKILGSQLSEALNKVRQLPFYNKMSESQKNSLELWISYNMFDEGLYTSLYKLVDDKSSFINRKHGGNWIAFGTCYENDDCVNNNISFLRHRYSGERLIHYNKFYNCKDLYLRVYGTEGFPSIQYDRSIDYASFEENVNLDNEFTKLFYLIHENVNPETVGFNVEYLKAIPWLLKCKVLRKHDDKLYVNIPVLTNKEVKELYSIILNAKENFVKTFKPLLKEFIKYKKLEIPSHLKSVPIVKQYHCATNSIVMALIRKSINENILYNGRYDEEISSIPSAMILVIDK